MRDGYTRAGADPGVEHDSCARRRKWQLPGGPEINKSSRRKFRKIVHAKSLYFQNLCLVITYGLLDGMHKKDLT